MVLVRLRYVKFGYVRLGLAYSVPAVWGFRMWIESIEGTSHSSIVWTLDLITELYPGLYLT